MIASSPRLRVSVVKSSRRARRGQTLILALGILFLLVLLGAIFVTSVLQNLARVGRQGTTDDALTLSLAGLQHAANQFRTSAAGADWRPETTEPVWLTPTPANAQIAQLRALDPDAQWLDPALNNNHPYVRVGTGRGRFLVRVTYLPQFRPANRTSETQNRADEFDPNSALLHIESIGRPGEFEPNDPTFYSKDPTQVTTPGTVLGQLRKVDAYVPIGLVDQLWWVTDVTNEQGPANLGVMPHKNPAYDPNASASADNKEFVEFPSLFEGAVRSNTSIRWHGRNLIRVYPSRAEGLFVKGQLLASGRSNYDPTQPQLRVEAMSDSNQTASIYQGRKVITPDTQDRTPTNDTIIDEEPKPVNSGTVADTLLDPATPAEQRAMLLYNAGHEPRHVVLNESFLRGTGNSVTAESTRFFDAPALNQLDPGSNVSRWLALTRDSGAPVTIRKSDGTDPHLVNSGWYGFTDESLPNSVRALGHYLDNFGDIQYANDRAAVKDEWLQRGASDVRRRGWVGDYYVPSVIEGSVLHPVAEVVLTRVPRDPANPGAGLKPVIQITRFDNDQRQLNLQPATGRSRLFYDPLSYDANTGALNASPHGQTRIFDYPPNGVFFAEGSIRVRGTIFPDQVGGQTIPKQLTIVSGGSIYIEGNILKGRPDCYVGLLAQDFVTLNPTAFTRIRPGDDVVVEGDTFDAQGKPTGYHFAIPQGGTLDFAFDAAEQLTNAMLFVKHTAPTEDASSETAVTMNLPMLSGGPWPNWNRDRYDFAATPPPTDPPGATTQGGSQKYYLFHQISAGASQTWAESNYQTPAGTPAANFERKGFSLPSVAHDNNGGALALPAGMEATLRLAVGQKDGTQDSDNDGNPDPTTEPNGQPYLLSRIVVLPPNGPMHIRVEAMVYAYTGSWFVIPPPFFNDNPLDTRGKVADEIAAAPNNPPARAPGTLPWFNDAKDVDGTTNQNSAKHYPFYHEPLNYDIELIGAVTENMPADPSEQALWASHLWIDVPDNDPTAFPLVRGQYSPRLEFRYDADLRRMVRARLTRTGQEFVAWVAPGKAPWDTVAGLADGIGTLAEVQQAAAAANSYVETLPILPRLPSGTLIYEGNTQ
jgi:hypothetical protein